MAFTVRSNSFKDGDYLANAYILSADFGFGCAGNNQSPHLAWSGAPAGTKSFAVTCLDPDAPTGSGFWHWLVVNIRASRRCRQSEGPATATGSAADTYRLRHARLWRSLSAGGRPSAPLSVHGFRCRDRQPAGDGGYLSRGHRLPTAFQYARQGGDHGPLQAMTIPVKEVAAAASTMRRRSSARIAGGGNRSRKSQP